MNSIDELKMNESVINFIAGQIEEILTRFFGPKKIGFALILFKFGQSGLGNYVSNARREDVIKSLRETADRIEKNEIIPPGSIGPVQ